MALYSKNIIIADSFETDFNESKNQREKLVILGGLLITILHDIMHCLTNILPSFEEKYEKLQNPFIRTYKKNLEYYNYVTGLNSDYDDKSEIDLIAEGNTDIIRDSGDLFEYILFKEEYYKSYNYLKAKYLFNEKNLNKSVENFNKDYNNFKVHYNNLELNYLNNNTGYLFKRKLSFRGCLLSPYEDF